MKMAYFCSKSHERHKVHGTDPSNEFLRQTVQSTKRYEVKSVGK